MTLDPQHLATLETLAGRYDAPLPETTPLASVPALAEG